MTRTGSKARTRQWELVGLWSALVILAAVATLAYKSIDGAADTLRWLEHTNLVLQQIEDVSSAYARASSARREYIIGGDPSRLADAPELDARVARAIAIVRASTEDNPDQHRRLDALAPLIGQRIAALDALVERRRVEGAASETAEGLELTTRIRDLREDMQAEENRLLAERDVRSRREMATTRLAEVVGTLVSLAILFYVFERLRHEVTLRRSSEEALRASERFLDSVVENIPNMIFVKGADELRFERINRAGEELLGVGREGLLGKNDFDFFPRQQADSFQLRDRETLANGVVLDIAEEPIQTKTGERWLHTKKVPILDESGAPRYLLGISEDITERRKAAAALKVAKDGAEAANQELEAFSYSVAHDLRAPLRAIDGFSRALEEDCGDKLDAEGLQHLERVRASARRMSLLIDGLLGLSRLTRGAVVRAKVDLTQMARRAPTGSVRPIRTGTSSSWSQEGLMVDGDTRLLAAVLDNLLGNAWKFTSKAPRRVSKWAASPKKMAPSSSFATTAPASTRPTPAPALWRVPATARGGRVRGIGHRPGHGAAHRSRHGGRVWAEGEVDRRRHVLFHPLTNGVERP